MSRVKGSVKSGGRTKGTPNKRIPEVKQLSTDAMNRISVLYDTGREGGETPLEFLLRLQNDENLELDLRIDCARASLPYIHQKVPVALEHSGPDEGAIELTLLADDAHRALENLIFIDHDEDDL